MADARGDAGVAAGDVVELQGPGTVTADVGGVHGDVGKLATVADVAGSASSLQKYDSGDDVYKGNIASFTAKEVQKIKGKGVASFFRNFNKWHCPYCTTKPKPKDGRFNHLLSHAEDVAIRGEDNKIRGQHAALAKAVTPA
ncbi:hypothetical protein D1007_03497 [Hordeum vulgare]|nr:hypothetical protein D1007_03497 [Hordeum vulgare]